ncbi:MAG: hypothetical protein M3463_01450 [Verrucomicrobiota bacterium]|nr:hypothetical protein [Verrucomicrobiota bacterium]
MKPPPPNDRAFALISTLAVLVIVSVLVVAYATTMRSERSASENFAERERAQAIAQGMLNRILADHATPPVAGGKRLERFTVDDNTKLPTPETEEVYYANKPAPGIYKMEPLEGEEETVSRSNHLVRISQPKDGDGVDAYTPGDWAYARQRAADSDPDAEEKREAFYPQDTAGNPIAPKWIDFYETVADGTTPGVPVGEVAFCIWDESGKIDINMAGNDPNINGIAPHNLGLESFVRDPLTFPSRLNGGDLERQRSNFSLREIRKPGDPQDRTGDDRWYFSLEEILSQDLIDPLKAKHVTTWSRDFDVRPEWDGDRSPENAVKFLRSYINNPKLFILFTEPKAGSHLVKNTLDESALQATLRQYSLPEDDQDWMQVMRLLAALRMVLPAPTDAKVGVDHTVSLPNDGWTNDDIFGIGLNIAQAATPPADHNLFAFNRAVHKVSPFLDPTVRIGIRVSPYVTEVAIKVKRTAADEVEVTEYIELWNPYTVDLSNERYYCGSWTGGGIGSGSTLATAKTQSLWGMTHRFETTGPRPGEFKVVINQAKDGRTSLKLKNAANFGSGQPFAMRTRPYIQLKDYWNTSGAPITGTNNNTREESSSFAVSIGPFYSAGGGDVKWNPVFYIEADRIKEVDDEAWASFQIDDPRMGPYTRYSANSGTAGQTTQMKYSWKFYPNSHSLYGMTAGGATSTKDASPYGDGYNANFGDNWPEGFNLNRALATFALPRRPFLNVGELGSVFANRPWRTLSFAETTSPVDENLRPGSSPKSFPTALLDYLTTVGTTSDSSHLKYKEGAPNFQVPPGKLVTENTGEREQDKAWLFEAVDPITKDPTGNLRPIRGRINLNSADKETLQAILKAPYRMVRSEGLMKWPGLDPKPIDGSDPSRDIEITIDPRDAEKLATEIVKDPKTEANAVRPFRSMADLGKLKTIKDLHEKYPDPVVDAIVGRLAQFGTVRQQIYTIDMIARTLNPALEKKRLTNATLARVITAEVRLLARVYFDTFSRKAFIESIEYR